MFVFRRFRIVSNFNCSMYTKIYFNDKPLFLAERLEGELLPYSTHDDAVIMDELSAPAINTILHEMRQEKVHAGIFLHNDLDELKTKIFRKFTMVPAAGGLVMNENDEVLMIFRRGHWDLPKGKLDEGETIENCAIREVQEETGLQDVTLIKPLVITYHTYEESGHHILKDSHWYLMTAHSSQRLVPEEVEQISEIKWVSKTEAIEIAKNTYPSIADVLHAAGMTDSGPGEHSNG